MSARFLLISPPPHIRRPFSLVATWRHVGLPKRAVSIAGSRLFSSSRLPPSASVGTDFEVRLVGLFSDSCTDSNICLDCSSASSPRWRGTST